MGSGETRSSSLTCECSQGAAVEIRKCEGHPSHEQCHNALISQKYACTSTLLELGSGKGCCSNSTVCHIMFTKVTLTAMSLVYSYSNGCMLVLAYLKNMGR